MISDSELVDVIELLDADALHRWIALGWVRPQQSLGSLNFDAADVARVRLICELHYELLIDEDSLVVVLSLMDQLYSTRRALGSLAKAVAAQPADVRARIAALLG
jgi:chaperone modulatory protein CbpM